MRRIQGLLIVSAIVAAAGIAPAIAQMSHDHGAIAMPMAAPAESASGAGEVRKIDVANAKLTLKHEAMKDAGMPAMTMVYPVANAAVLRGLKVGDKVRFHAATAGGRTTITDLQTVQ